MDGEYKAAETAAAAAAAAAEPSDSAYGGAGIGWRQNGENKEKPLVRSHALFSVCRVYIYIGTWHLPRCTMTTRSRRAGLIRDDEGQSISLTLPPTVDHTSSVKPPKVAGVVLVGCG